MSVSIPLRSVLRTRQSTKAACSACLATFVKQHRGVHSIPNLDYDIQAGIKPFLSPTALHGTAIEWHQGNLDRLNDLVRGTKLESKSVAQTVIDASKERENALTFAYASEALNNAFFLSCLTPEAQPRKNLSVFHAIDRDFGSLTSFINYFSSYAMGMFGTGYVWLVMDGEQNLAVLGTHGAGTVLVQGRTNRAPWLEPFTQVDNTSSSPKASLANESTSNPTESKSSHRRTSSIQGHVIDTSASQTGSNQARQISTASKALASIADRAARSGNSRSTGSASRLKTPSFLGDLPSANTQKALGDYRFVSIHPLMCLSLHPHVYIPDYGIIGKEKYIESFWGNVNWSLLDRRYEAATQAIRAR